MRLFFLIICYLSLLKAEIYYAKLEPFEKYTIKSEVSGKVIFSDISKESLEITNQKIIQIDDELDNIELKSTIDRVGLLKQSIEILKEQIVNEEISFKIKDENYKSLKELTTKSKVQKDVEYFALINSKNQLLNLKNQLVTLNSQLNELNYKIAVLNDRIKNKKIFVKSGFINKIFVKDGDFVNIGTALLDIYDTSKAKLQFFISLDDLKNIDLKKIYMNDNLIDIKPSKIYKVADDEKLSSYKVELILNKPAIFSELVKIEIK
ncbi:MAG: hypothetical protein HXX81_02990 [Campylobacterales bacterium]|nr:hypothetical protein [Campylobacterales bacterium]